MRTLPASVLLVVLAVACGEEADPDPMVCRDIDTDEDYALRGELDLLFLVGNAGSMTEVQAALPDQVYWLVNQLESLRGGLPDLHAAVLSDDGGALQLPAGCPSLTDGGDYISDSLIDPNVASRAINYTGQLADQLACMLQVGTEGGEVERPLASLARALEDQVGWFRRPAASLAIVIVTDGEDASPAEVSAYVDRVRDLAPVPMSSTVSVVSGGRDGCALDGFTDASPAPRLADFAAAFGDAGRTVSLCGQDPFFAGIAAPERLAEGTCLSNNVLEAADCVVRYGDVRIPSCDESAPPCFTVSEDELSCPNSASHRRLAVDHGGSARPDGTIATAECPTEPECP